MGKIIDISKLSIGQKVHYKPDHYGEDEWENGMVKEVPEWITDAVRVVYNCAGNWEQFMDYTSALTNMRDLYLGWKFTATEGAILEFESGNRFEILKVWDTYCFDLKAMQPVFEWMPDFRPVYYSIRCKQFKIINEDTKK